MADERLLRVEGLADLQRAFRVADRRIANDFRKELREAAEPVRMVIGLIEDIPTCAELIQRIVSECREHLRVALSMATAA